MGSKAGPATHQHKRMMRILALAVEDYLRSGKPIASQALLDRHQLGICSATVRNSMAELERRGLLFSAHASAGRVPTARGFGVYVRALMRSRPAPERAVRQVAESLRKLTSDELAESAAASIAQHAEALAFVSLPAALEAKVRKLKLVHVTVRRCSAIIVTETGEVRQQLIEMPAGVSAADLGRASAYFNSNFSGQTLRAARASIVRRIPHLHERIALLLRDMLDGVHHEPTSASDELHVSGSSRLLRNPRLSIDSSNLRELVDLLQQKELILGLLERGLASDELSVRFGAESGVSALSACAVVTVPYAADDGCIAGTVGLIGPLRMPYASVLPLVGTAAEMVAASLAEVRRQMA